MDWTGGTRRRFAARKDHALHDKQRAHFARARAQHGPSSAPRIPPLRTTSQEELHDGVVSRSIEAHSAAVHSSSPRPVMVPPSHPASDTHVPTPSLSRNCKSATGHTEDSLVRLRRQLLNRPDWLQLSTNQPFQRNKVAAESKLNAGKRCGIRKSVRRPRSHLRQILPLVVEQDVVSDHGAVDRFPEVDDIRIKVGTDTLTSQSQSFSVSNVPDRFNTSMQAPFTDFESLTKDPVLPAPEHESVEAALTTNRSQMEFSQDADEDSSFLQAGGPFHDPDSRVPRSTEERLESAVISSEYSETNIDNVLALRRSKLDEQYTRILSDDFDQRMRKFKHVLETESAGDDTVFAQEALLREGGAAGRDNDDETASHFLSDFQRFTPSDVPFDTRKSLNGHPPTSNSDRQSIPLPHDKSSQVPTISTPRGAGTQFSFLPNILDDAPFGQAPEADTADLFEEHRRKLETHGLFPRKDVSSLYAGQNSIPSISTPKGAGTQLSFLSNHSSEHRWYQPCHDSCLNKPEKTRLRTNGTRSATNKPLWREFVLNSDEIDQSSSRGEAFMRGDEEVWLTPCRALHQTISSEPGATDLATRGQPTLVLHESTPSVPEVFRGVHENAKQNLTYDALVDDQIDMDSRSSMRYNHQDGGDTIEDVTALGGSYGGLEEGDGTLPILDYSRSRRRSRRSFRSDGDGKLRRHRSFLAKREKE